MRKIKKNYYLNKYRARAKKRSHLFLIINIKNFGRKKHFV